MGNEAAEKSNDSLFGKDFFDSGKPVLGAFSSYSFDEYCLTFKPLCEIIKKHFNPHRVLDVGCAKGAFVFGFKQLCVDTYGVDVSSYAISCAPNFLQPFLHVVDLDKDSLPFKDGFFDFIALQGSLEYLRNHRRAIAELERVMADGGTLLLTCISKRPKGDLYRINVHKKTFWVREFGERWRVPRVYCDFMSDYFQKVGNSELLFVRVKKRLLGRSRIFDAFLISLRDILVSLGISDYFIVLLTFSKRS